MRCNRDYRFLQFKKTKIYTSILTSFSRLKWFFVKPRMPTNSEQLMNQPVLRLSIQNKY